MEQSSDTKKLMEALRTLSKIILTDTTKFLSAGLRTYLRIHLMKLELIIEIEVNSVVKTSTEQIIHMLNYN